MNILIRPVCDDLGHQLDLIESVIEYYDPSDQLYVCETERTINEE